MEKRTGRILLTLKPSYLEILKRIALEHELSAGKMVELMMRNWVTKESLINDR